MSEPAPDREPTAQPEEIDLNGLFTLYRRADGTFQVEYGKLTATRELNLRWKLHPSEGELAFALLTIAVGSEIFIPNWEIPAPRFGILGPSNLAQVHRLATKSKAHAVFLGLILNKFSESIGAELAIVADHSQTPKAVKTAREKIEKKVSKALEAISLRSERKAHGSAATVEVTLDTGETREAVLPWIALEIARQLVAEKRRLPAKGEIQLAIGERYPELRGLGKTTWRNTWKDCGLASLHQGERWEFEERKRAVNAKTKKVPRKKKASRTKNA